MSVPEQLVGAWRRTGLFIDGIRRVDFCDVLWLQTSTWFVDIRHRLGGDVLNLEPAGVPAKRMARRVAMAGVAEWAEPVMTWHATFGSRAEAASESYRLSWRDNVVVEEGSISHNNETFAFAEEWLRMSAASDEPAIRVREQYLFIAIGRWSIEVRVQPGGDRLVAVRRDRIGDRWVEIASVGLV